MCDQLKCLQTKAFNAHEVLYTHGELASQVIMTIAKMIGNPIVTSASLVCSINIGGAFEKFLVEEGVVIFVDGKEFKVLKNGISK